MNTTESDQQFQIIKSGPGFIAALDQSGGSTPHALRDYGIKEDAWSSEEEMFAIVHRMRTRIMTSPAFDGDRILGAILFCAARVKGDSYATRNDWTRPDGCQHGSSTFARWPSVRRFRSVGQSYR